MMPVVGSIKTTVEEGESVQRGQEFGYFAFGSISKSKLVDLHYHDSNAVLLLT